jgi:hypothetical protein
LRLVGFGLLRSLLCLFCLPAGFLGLCRGLLALLFCCGALLGLKLGLLLRLLSLLSCLFRLLLGLLGLLRHGLLLIFQLAAPVRFRLSLLLSLLGLLGSLLTLLFRRGTLPRFSFSFISRLLRLLLGLPCLGLRFLSPSFRFPTFALDSGLLFGFEAHHASLFGRLHGVARHCANWFFFLFPAVIVLCLIQQSFGTLEDFWCVLIGMGITGHADGITCLDEIRRGFFVIAVNTLLNRFNLGNVCRPWQNLVPDTDSLGTSFRIGPNRILGYDQLARCAHCKIGFCRDYQSEGLEVGGCMERCLSVLIHQLPYILWISLGADCPKHISDIREIDALRGAKVLNIDVNVDKSSLADDLCFTCELGH